MEYHNKVHQAVRLFLILLMLWFVVMILHSLLSHQYENVAATKTLTPEASQVVPRVVHYTWYSAHRHRFRFHHLMSMLSVRKFLRPTRIFLWCDTPPRGHWWEEAGRRIPELVMRLRPAPTSIFGRPVRIPEHQSDVVRLMVLLEHGGIYLDLDVVVLRPLERLLYFNISMGYQLDHSGLCNGVILARKKDRFLQTWFEEYRYFLDRQWDYHSVKLPDRLARLYPGWIHIEPRAFHRPNFFEIEWIYQPGKIFPWRKNFAMHLWYRFYNVDHNPDDIKQLNSTLGEMFRYIYYGSAKILPMPAIIQ